MSRRETGIKDNCGGPVCEGDFVRGIFECAICSHKVVGVIEYIDTFAAFMFVMPDSSFVLSEVEDIEVIGNTQDNPKLWDAICDGDIDKEN